MRLGRTGTKRTLLMVSILVGFSWFGTASATIDTTARSSMYIVYNNQPTPGGVAVNAELVLATHNIRLNAFEVELHFDPDIHQITDVMTHPSLCEPQFLIEKEINVDEGIIMVSCGTTTPFITGVEYMPILTVAMESKDPAETRFQFGPRTSFRIHDGFGTAAPVTILEDKLTNDFGAHS